MSENEYFGDDELNKLIKLGKRNMPIQDFEEIVMAQIHAENRLSNETKKDLKWSLMFGVIGLVFIFILAYFTSKLEFDFHGVNFIYITLFAYFALGVFSLLAIEQLYKLWAYKIN